jgi:hypothetical protein
MIGQVPLAFAVVPGAARISSHAGNLHDFLHGGKRVEGARLNCTV